MLNPKREEEIARGLLQRASLKKRPNYQKAGEKESHHSLEKMMVSIVKSH